MGCVGCNGSRANIGAAEGLVQTRTGMAGDDLEKKNRRRHSQFNSSLSHSQANHFMRKIFARHFSFDLTLILEVFSAQKKMHVQVFPVVNFNLSHPNVEPLRGKSAIEPISK